MPTGEEIRRDLTVFAQKWSVYQGSERAEAQTFLNELFACYGTDRSAVARFEEAQGGRFLDLIWPRTCIIEMKRPSEARRLEHHRDQAFDYWRNAADPARGVPSPRWVVICAFAALEIWEPGLYPNGPRATLTLVELPEHYDALLFLAGREPVFLGGEARVTRAAVEKVTALYTSLRERRAADPDVLRDFILQTVWCLFAEDLGQITDHAFTQIADDLIAQPHRSSADDLGGLFAVLNAPGQRPTHGLYAGVPYADGGLFERPARVHLAADELLLLREACAFQWGKVEPSIFGNLLEGGLGHDQQWLLGAHYTHEADIQKVVQPTIVRPWAERIATVTSLREAQGALDDLMRYVVLDPACGSGNFLYVAYRELRRIEHRLHERVAELRRQAGMSAQPTLIAFFPLANIRGIEINRFAASLARVTLWMGHKLAVEELSLNEATLPLAPLGGIVAGDALRLPWPTANAIIGNPPFHGTKSLRSALGDQYVDWLRDTYKVGVKDYCVYWFRKAHEALRPGDRAGFVATNSVAEGKNREASLEYIVHNGGQIVSAVREQPWPGEATVHVSIVNWTKTPPLPSPPLTLNGVEVVGITSQLRSGQVERLPQVLAANSGRQFFGVVQSGDGFILANEEAGRLLRRADADYSQVVKPFLVGNDITKNPQLEPSRWIIDFGEMALEEAEGWSAALAIVRDRVKPSRDNHPKAREREQWWKFSRSVRELFVAVTPLPRFIACPATAKRYFMVWCEPSWCPSNATSVFAFDDDYALGILSSDIHGDWARLVSTALETRPRYTVASFATFPWPAAAESACSEIARVGGELFGLRRRICRERNMGLGTLQNAVDEGAWQEVRDLQRQLNALVAEAYGWPSGVVGDRDRAYDLLLDLNHEIAAGRVAYAPFGQQGREGV